MFKEPVLWMFWVVLSYIAQNKDLIAKPLLSSAGETGALVMNEGARAIIERLR